MPQLERLTNVQSLNVKIDTFYKDRLETEAKKLDLSQAQLVRRIIAAYFDTKAQKEGSLI